MVKPLWNTGASEAREDMPRKGLNKADGECGVRGDVSQESLGLPPGTSLPKGEEDQSRDGGTCC